MIVSQFYYISLLLFHFIFIFLPCTPTCIGGKWEIVKKKNPISGGIRCMYLHSTECPTRYAVQQQHGLTGLDIVVCVLIMRYNWQDLLINVLFCSNFISVYMRCIQSTTFENSFKFCFQLCFNFHIFPFFSFSLSLSLSLSSKKTNVDGVF